MPFLATPAEGAPSPPSDAELAVHTKNAVDHIIAAAGGVGTQAIHIIYTASIYVDEAFKVNYTLDKHYVFGSGISKIDKLKIKQIEADTEFSLTATAEENDAYLNEYVDLLIDALNDPDYVVTGTVRYDNNIYVNGDTIFYFWDHVTMIDGPMAGREWLELLVNARYPVNNISWAEFNTNIPIIEEEDEEDVFLRLDPEHFRGIQKLRATFGETTTTVYFYPINLQIHLAGNDEIEYLEPYTPTSNYPIIAYNNGRYFTHHHGLNIRTRIERDNGRFLDHQSISFAPSGSDQLAFGIEELGLSRSDGRRFFINLEAIRPSGEILYTRKRRIFVKWPFDLENLVVTPTNNDGVLQEARSVNSNSNDTLYIVSRNNDVSRDIQFKLDWNGQGPTQYIDYWDDSPPGIVGAEPSYYFGAANYFGVDTYASSIEQPSLIDRRTGPISVEYDSRFFPGVGIFNPDVWDLDINTYNAGVRVFDQNEEVKIAFLRENRRVIELVMPNWLIGIQNWVNNKAATVIDRIEAAIPIPLDVNVQIETTANSTTFLTEDDESSAYVITREKAVGGNIGFVGEAVWDLSPGPWLTVGPYVKVGLGIGLEYELEDKRIHNRNEFEPSSTSIEMPITGKIAVGAIIALNFQDQDTTGINFVVDINGACPIEVKPKLTFNIDPEGTCFLVEANAGPASLNIAVSLGAQFSWGANNIDMNILDLSWSYPMMDKILFTPVKIPLNTLQEWDCN